MTKTVRMECASGHLKGVTVAFSDAEYRLVEEYARQHGQAIDEAVHELLTDGLQARLHNRIGGNSANVVSF